MKGNIYIRFIFKSESQCNIVGYSDLDVATDLGITQSIIGYTFTIDGSLAIWKATP